MTPDIIYASIAAVIAVLALWGVNRIAGSNQDKTGPGDEDSDDMPDAALLQDLRLSGDMGDGGALSGVYRAPNPEAREANNRAALLAALLDMTLLELGRLDPAAEQRVRAKARKICGEETAA